MPGLSRWLEGEGVEPAGPRSSADASRGGTNAPRLQPEPSFSPALSPIPQARGETSRKAALVAAFDPAHPVQSPADLCGRKAKLDGLFDAILDQKKHAIIYGARGSGKTSLARVFGDYADQRDVVVIYMACEPNTSFGELIGECVRSIPSSCVGVEALESFETRLGQMTADSRPRDFVELLASLVNCQVVLILDEFDQVTDPQVYGEYASFMKLLCDASVPVQLLIVGIATSVAHIIDAHPSLRRHLTAVTIGRISQEGVNELVDHGAARCGLRFDAAARALITRVGCGSPYHVRLFCYQAGLEALRQGVDHVDLSSAFVGLTSAVEQWAALNEADSELFGTIARLEPAARDQVAEIARLAAVQDGFTRATSEPGPEAVSVLEPSLTTDARGVARFRDSLAPQFLLGMIELNRVRQAQGSEPPTPRAPQPSRLEPVISAAPAGSAAFEPEFPAAPDVAASSAGSAPALPGGPRSPDHWEEAFHGAARQPSGSEPESSATGAPSNRAELYAPAPPERCAEPSISAPAVLPDAPATAPTTARPAALPAEQAAPAVHPLPIETRAETPVTAPATPSPRVVESETRRVQRGFSLSRYADDERGAPVRADVRSPGAAPGSDR